MLTRTDRLIDLHPAPADASRLVVQGMGLRPRQLPAWLLYDDEGSRLFEAICEQPEYGLTRTETALLEKVAPALALELGAGRPQRETVVVEFGAGNARKVEPLLEALRPVAFVALDINAGHLAMACDALRQRHPSVEILGICCDYSSLDRLPLHPLLHGRDLIGFYPGSSLGNFDPTAARGLLRQFGRLLGGGSRLLVGIDQPKSVARMEAAYNDQAGWSAAFAFNLLTRLNRDLGGSFDPADYTYRAWWEPELHRIVMALMSRRDHSVRLAGQTWRFVAEEPLITEFSVKYTPEVFRELAAAAQWRWLRRWSDGNEDVSLHLLTQADSQAEQHRVKPAEP